MRAFAQEASSGGGGGEATGMPQLDFSTWPNQIFWLVVALAAIYVTLRRVALPRIGAVLAERQGTITNDIAAAEELKSKAAEAEEAYEQALADARAEARRIIDEAQAEIDEEVEARRREAEARIDEKMEESQKRIDEIESNAAENVRIVARDVAEAIVSTMGREPDGAALDRAVDKRTEAA